MRLFNRRNLILLLLLTGVVIGLVLWREFGETLPTVDVARVYRGDLTQNFRTNGVVEPAESRDVHAEIPGQVIAVFVHQGDEVRAGLSLARLDDRAALAAVAAARAQLLDAERAEAQAAGDSSHFTLNAQIKAATVDLQVAAAAHERDQVLFHEKAISQPEFDQTNAAYEKALDHLQALKQQRVQMDEHTLPLEEQAAKARVDQARAALAAAESRLSETRVPAPMTGTVLVRPPNPGTLVNPGDLLVTVGDIQNLRVRAFIDQPDFSAIHIGAPVQITSTGFPGDVWKGQVERVSAQLTTIGKRVVGEALCSIDNGRDPLPVNSNVDLTFTSREMREVLLAPVDAVLQSDSHNSVYLVRSGRLRQQAVEVGASNTDWIVVLKGLKEGDTVLDDLSIRPKEGMRVATHNVGP